MTAPRWAAAPASPTEEAVAKAAALLAEAKRPAILAGGGSRGAARELRALAERLGAPVVTTLNAKGVLDEGHPLAVGSCLRLAAGRRVAQEADVLLVVGSKLGEAELWVPRLDVEGSVIRIDLLESQIAKNQRADVGLVGDAAATLAVLHAAIRDQTRGKLRSQANARVREVRAAVRAESLELSAVNTLLAEAIAASLPDRAIVATDSSQIAYLGLLNSLSVSEPNSTPYMATYATLGYGLPAALGAKIAAPHRPAFVVTGDGALMFSMNEFITVVEQGEDVTVIVVDNGGYAEIKQNEADAGIAPVGVDLVQPDWVAVAAAFGGFGQRVADAGELSAAVDAALLGGGLQLIHVDQSSFRIAGNA
jgi:acetolactate synthase-1/2/3 large subunit